MTEFLGFLEMGETEVERFVNKQPGSFPARAVKPTATQNREQTRRMIGKPVLSDCQHPVWIVIRDIMKSRRECENCDYRVDRFFLVSA